MHTRQIKQGLGISGIATDVSCWRYVPANDAEGPDRGAQVDLVIRRADKVVHLCEMKFSEGEYIITKEYAERLTSRAETFKAVTGIHHGVVHTFVTPSGVMRGKHYGIVHSEVTSEALFAK